MAYQEILHTDYLDILFAGHNKKYGGYELRKHYHNRVVYSLGILLSALSVIICCSYYQVHQTKLNMLNNPIFHPIIASPIQPPPPHEIITPPPPPAAKKIKQVAHIIPIVTDDKNVTPDKKMVENSKLDKVQIGLNTSLDGDSTALNITTTTGDKEGTAVVAPPAPPTKVLKWVAQMPEFKGNIMSYLNNHIHYPAEAKANGIEGRVIITFIVNEDGSVSNATVLKGIGGGCNQEALNVVDNMPKWTPGRQNGIPVKVYFTLPISFSIK